MEPTSHQVPIEFMPWWPWDENKPKTSMTINFWNSVISLPTIRIGLSLVEQTYVILIHIEFLENYSLVLRKPLCWSHSLVDGLHRIACSLEGITQVRKSRKQKPNNPPPQSDLIYIMKHFHSKNNPPTKSSAKEKRTRHRGGENQESRDDPEVTPRYTWEASGEQVGNIQRVHQRNQLCKTKKHGCSWNQQYCY